MKYSADELMTVVASRQLLDDDVCFVGIGAPSTASNLARLTHAPNITLIYESGTLNTKPDVLPLSIGDGVLVDTAQTVVPVVEIFDYWLQGGRISKGFLAGAQIDKFANINTTVIGDYDNPTVRLPGAGGAPEIAAHCRETMIIAKHSRRTLVDKVDFITTFGHGTGGTARRDVGLTTAGPVLLITDLCIMTPDPETKELIVTSLHEGVTRNQISDATGWAVKFSDDLETTAPPTEHELIILRKLRERTDNALRRDMALNAAK